MLDKSYDGKIFDLDGTMLDTRKPICEAWNIILSSRNIARSMKS